MAYNTIQTKTEGRVGVITLDRPSALNALCDELTRAHQTRWRALSGMRKSAVWC
jgi:enoyl-CoA hydratase/carnithine racemase